jgi:glycosyltransferase involved in cell wall biosynthesis
VTRHVAHVLSSFGMGGQERVALDLAASQLRAGWRVSAVSLAPPPDGPLAAEFRTAGVTVDRVARPRPGVDLRLVVRLARWFRSHGVDLVHSHNRMALIYAAPAGRLAKAAVVHTKHGRNPAGGTRLVAGNLAGRLVHEFVAVSEEIAAFARARREVSERRLAVISNGVELSRFHPDPEARERIRGELALAPEVCAIGTVGRVATEKNHALLVRAVAPLLDARTHLVVAGDGPLLPALRDLVAELGIAAHAHLLGMRRDVPAVLNALDVFAMSSDTEGLPLVVLEAMATALPIVATAVGGIPDVVVDGRTGFLVPAGDQTALRARLATLVADPAQRREIGARARTEAVDHHSAERMQRAYMDLYARLLSPGPREP